jgi:GT2 family glycosyltransferase
MDFTVAVPTYNRPERLRACLESLAALDYPRTGFEVIVADDGGSHDLAPVVEPFRRHIDVRLLVEPHRGPASTRNAGAGAARGRFVAFTDDDCAPARDWLVQLRAAFDRLPGHMVGGHTINAIEDHLCPAASQILIDYLYAYFNRDPTDAQFLVSCNVAVPADAYRALGGFNPEFPDAAAEDRDLCDRWRARGLRMAYVPDAVVYHRHALSLAGFWRQHLGYGRGAHRFHMARARRSKTPFKVEPLAFYSRLILYPFKTGASQPAQLSALLALSQVANVSGFLAEWLAELRRS